eukprot:5473169-Pyramimonas_sp.AAC.1
MFLYQWYTNVALFNGSSLRHPFGSPGTGDELSTYVPADPNHEIDLNEVLLVCKAVARYGLDDCHDFGFATSPGSKDFYGELAWLESSHWLGLVQCFKGFGSVSAKR